MQGDYYLLEQFDKGGPLMWVLLASSLVALTVILERLWVLGRAPAEEAASKQAASLLQLLDAGSGSACLQKLHRTRGVLAAVYAAVLRKHMTLESEGYGPTEQRDELAREADLACREHLGQYFPVLSTIGNIAPLIGLLGTITGMIKAFAAIATSGVGDPSQVADGISEALITTASGLMIAIPVIVAHRYLAVWAGGIMRRLEVFTHAMGHALTKAQAE
jgi:biopolymer transport protein ExbB